MATVEPEVEKKFIEDSLGVTSQSFGEQITHTVWVEANKSPNISGSTFNKRLIVVGKCKIISIKRGTFGKSVELEFHLYNVSEICAESDDSFTIKYNGENNEQLGITIKAPLDKLQILIRAIRTSYRRITCGFPETSMMKLNLPENKLIDFEVPLIMSSAHGFVDGYIAHSYYYPRVYKSVGTLDFIRLIDALYSSDITEIDFTQLAGIEPSSELSFNLFTAITSLRNNTYFKSVNLSGLPHANIISAIGMCLETNKSITKLNLSNLRVEQSLQPLANGLVKNPSNVIQALDLSKNNIPFPIMATLCECFSKFSHGLVSLNLSKCELLPKTIAILFESFERNFGMSLAIKYLNLSHNKFGDIGSQAIGGWMAKIRGHHSLDCLVLANCNLNFQLMGPPLRVVDIPRLDLSLNRIDRTSAKLLGNEVFDTVMNLSELNFSGCGMNADSLEDIFISFNRNRKISNISLNLSHNALGAREATLMSKSISGCRYLEALDISNNRLNCRSLMELLNAIKNIDQFNLHELNIANNYFSQGPEGDQLCQQLASLINTFPTIRTLNISGGKYPLSKSLTPLLESLVKNNSLKELDISDNGLGDSMASIIGEMLRENTSLIYINLDNNQFGLSGWTAIAQPLLFDINRTLNHLIFPKTLASAYTSTLIQNFASTLQSFGSLSKEKRNQIIQLFQKMQDKLAENRFETSVLDSVYVSEYFNKTPYTVHIPEDFVTPLVDVPEHLSSLPPPSSPTLFESVNSSGTTSASVSTNSSSHILQHSINMNNSNGTNSINTSNSSVGSNTGTTNNTNNNGGNNNKQLNGAGSSTPTTVLVAPIDKNQRSRSNSNSSTASSAVSLSKRSNSSNSAAPPRQLITQTSDWQPNEESEADIYDTSNNNSFIAYSTDDESDNYTQDSYDDNSSRKSKQQQQQQQPPIRKPKPKSIKSNASVSSVKSSASIKSTASVKSVSSVKSSSSIKSSKSVKSTIPSQPPPVIINHENDSEQEEEEQPELEQEEEEQENIESQTDQDEQVDFQDDDDNEITENENNNNNNNLNEFHSDSQQVL
ncbi:hypothetical protein RB653_000481 [Dictyostelium firmibasis]|uniref:Leucine-rich repeat-containing protein n=1 Tax=Dictyostelium firmibasis TaxID=79012 RepID=A0AAN7U2T4_9MYCE